MKLGAFAVLCRPIISINADKKKSTDLSTIEKLSELNERESSNFDCDDEE